MKRQRISAPLPGFQPIPRHRCKRTVCLEGRSCIARRLRHSLRVCAGDFADDRRFDRRWDPVRDRRRDQPVLERSGGSEPLLRSQPHPWRVDQWCGRNGECDGIGHDLWHGDRLYRGDAQQHRAAADRRADVHPLALGSNLPASVNFGADLCLDLTLNALAQVQNGSATVNVTSTGRDRA